MGNILVKRYGIDSQYYKDVLESSESDPVHPKCPVCNKNLMNDTYCIYCGSKVHAEISSKPREEQICVYCRIELDQDAKYCKLCGRAVRKSRNIPASVKREVWRRDEGHCVECGSRENLEYDHIIPFSKGGSNTARNIQLLCERCNREKRDTI